MTRKEEEEEAAGLQDTSSVSHPHTCARKHAIPCRQCFTPSAASPPQAQLVLLLIVHKKSQECQTEAECDEFVKLIF